MTKPNESIEKVQRRRKAVVWTREKITQLIKLYRHHDCLWNHYTEAYKNKDRRTRAIEDICSSLLITKTDFGKKVHNLRNQFNSEMKKIERRIKGNGESVQADLDICRWKHFESLRFLQGIIEPRPGGYQPKIRRKESVSNCDYTSEEEIAQQQIRSNLNENCRAVIADTNDYQYEESTILQDEEALHSSAGQLFNNKDQIANIKLPLTKDSSFNLKSNSHIVPSVLKQKYQVGENLEGLKKFEGSIVELQSGGVVTNVAGCNGTSVPQNDKCPPLVRQDTSMHKRNFEIIEPVKIRDQWDTFGELIASEFRHLNSDASRKKLKRKIMHAMLEVGDEDDAALR